ncbi:MAG: BREX-1 system adenine-specific DNA-methyltransferase PglX, partial [Chloroflexota bacterium]|nr:BREX-1 system adenine-specific DNA-methyltransferase PglX [Chloroflexota bacterium]
MDTNALKKFAQEARRELLEQVEARLEQVLHTDSVELREKLGVVNELRDQLKKKSKENLIEEVAYTWFNRFCALRYMDVNHITKMGIVSPMPNFTQPEILQDAKQGIFDKDWRLDKSRVQGLLNGTIPSTNPEGEAYRLLLVAVCNSYAEEMDFLFPRIEDYTELLMPEDLLSTQSVLHSVREALTKEVCQDVEVIGWLYQFYISEKKDQVMGQKGKVASEDIPAVTQLFTPHWIVRYMVENSLGRLWLLNHPRSKIRNQMEFYIEPAKQEEESLLPEGEGQDEGGDGNEGEGSFLKVDSPEELKILDPACGSGHILTYAFVLLYAIYEEMGYDPISIPQLILEKNLYGIEIDKRAAMLSSFALMMKAVEKDKRFLTREVQPNILEMEDVSFEPKEVKAYMAKVGEDLWTQDLWLGLQQFENAKTFGSLIRPVLKDVPELRERLKMKGVFEELFLANTNKKVQKVLKMSEYLSPRHQVVVANPPYMGGKNLNKILKDYARDNFPDSKSDLFAMFIEHGFELIKDYGYNAMVTMQSWMFLSSFEKMRKKLLDTATIECMVHMANMVMGIAFGTAATVWINQYKPKLEGQFSYVNYEDLDNENKPTEFPVKNDRLATASATDFKKIPGAPISYWLPRRIYEIFEKSNSLDNYYNFQIGMITGNNQKYIRNWYEVNLRDIGFGFSSRSLAKASLKKWFPYAKGGGFRRWAGNRSFVINWEKDGYQLQNTLDPTGSRIWAHNFNLDMIFKPSISWNSVTSSDNSFRYFPEGFLFDSAGGICQPVSRNNLSNLLGYLNSPFADILLPIVNPTINLPPGYLGKLPYKEVNCEEITERLISLTMGDWDSYE